GFKVHSFPEMHEGLAQRAQYRSRSRPSRLEGFALLYVAAGQFLFLDATVSQSPGDEPPTIKQTYLDMLVNDIVVEEFDQIPHTLVWPQTVRVSWSTSQNKAEPYVPASHMVSSATLLTSSFNPGDKALFLNRTVFRQTR